MLMPILRLVMKCVFLTLPTWFAGVIWLFLGEPRNLQLLRLQQLKPNTNLCMAEFRKQFQCNFFWNLSVCPSTLFPSTAIALPRNHLFQQQTKHVDVKYHFSRDAVEKNHVESPPMKIKQTVSPNHFLECVIKLFSVTSKTTFNNLLNQKIENEGGY
jgi:hypothetical protein